MNDFTSIEAPEGMILTTATTNVRLPATRKTIQVDTGYERSYTYNIMIELKLSKTTWAEYLYSFSGVNHKITVVYGAPDTSLSPVISAPASGFPSKTGKTMYQTLFINEGTNGLYEYVFDHFTCNGAVLSNNAESGKTCTIYNISSSNTAIVPIVDYNGYSID
jgi:hypothetical protein